MHIQHKVLTDKIECFVLAGIAKSTSGWDSAIPQTWCDELARMGIVHPARWFAADCTGPSAFPVLHHVGEAYIALAEHRSSANQEIWHQLYEGQYTMPKRDDDLYQFIVHDQPLMDEADAGFVDMNIVIRAFHAGSKTTPALLILKRLVEDVECYCSDVPGTPCGSCEAKAYLTHFNDLRATR